MHSVNQHFSFITCSTYSFEVHIYITVQALLEGLDRAVNDEEIGTVTIYIALVANPHPQFVAKLEELISSDAHSGDPLLLAYAGIISRASPDLQQRMTLFLINRLPQAETNSTSLIHHILSLGNAASPRLTSFLIDYLGHPDKDVQLTSILAMRFLMNESSVQESLKELLYQPRTSDEHVAMIAKALLYGTERAKLNYQPKPYSSDFAEALVTSSIHIEDEELHDAITTYLQSINTDSSKDLLKFFKFAKTENYDAKYSNTTRFRRGTKWNDDDPLYNLVAPISARFFDLMRFRHRLSYIWAKKFGGGDINAKIAAGGFVGLNNAGGHKLFGRAVVRANFYDQSLTFIDFIVHHEKTSISALTKLYANVLGITLKNVNLREGEGVCVSHEEPIYGEEYTIIDFGFSIFVVVGTLNFNLKATVQLSAGLHVEGCENHGILTVAAGMSPTLTIKVYASGDLEILVRKNVIFLPVSWLLAKA